MTRYIRYVCYTWCRWMMFVLSIKVLKLLRSTILFIAHKTLENSEGVIKNEQFRETGNKGYTRRRQTKQKHNTICVGHHYAQTNTNNVNKTCTLLQTIGSKDEPNIVFMRKS